VTHEIEVIYEDNHLLGVCKPGGLLVQGDRTGDPTALGLAKDYIKEAYDKPGAVFLGLVHRIDRPVSGVVVFARTSKAASRLARAFHDRRVEKTYIAVVIGAVVPSRGTLPGSGERPPPPARRARPGSERARRAELSYRALASRSGLTLVEIRPHTGRHHQIRLQLSAAGHPILGDLKYGAGEPLPDRTIALHSARLVFAHPVGGREVVLAAKPPVDRQPWRTFRSTIEDYFSPGE
jgi:23S rRNA pseudouridine1911/1915/1917 synthase